ncbi:uncharacterized protein LOC127420466 [Myxocyprinus asiaticus]|uniref:uncharacterized protein LOC127420466 n=1 Tax=Myxocyprinus asiaticus TaxID=70543 RepID=UPI002221DF43|nr:uncharacterized protein LOC127420466 [Myxocyprinus asiaticus]
MKLEKTGRPFAFTQRLRDTCRKWLLVGDRDVMGVIDQVVLEQLIHRLPKGMAEWVQCHHPVLLEEAVRLTEDHMAAYPRVEEPSYSLSPPPMFSTFSSPSPLPSHSALSPGPFAAPWRRGVPPPRPVSHAQGSVPPTSTVPRRSPPQPEAPTDAGASIAPGPACWSCGDPGHFCAVMELGTVVWIPDTPQTAPDQAGAYRIPTDASDRGLGAVLSQVVEGEERPVLYISRKLSLRETKYSTVEKESLAIKWAVLTLHYYLLGRAFNLCSDHAPLQWLHRMKDTNARITRWYLALQPFKFKVVHRPGAQMAVADFLSRNEGGVVDSPDGSPA